MDETCGLCDGTEIYQGQLTHRPNCPRITEPAVIVLAVAALPPKIVNADGQTVCRCCGLAESATRRLFSPDAHDFGCVWRRARALYPDGV